MRHRLRPMKCADVRRILKSLGFEQDPQGGTNHEQWRAMRGGVLRKVTVSCHKGEVHKKDVRSIISQAGLTKKEWFDAL